MSDKFIKSVDEFWLGNTEMHNLGGQLKMKTQLQKHQCCMSWSHKKKKNKKPQSATASTVTPDTCDFLCWVSKMDNRLWE